MPELALIAATIAYGSTFKLVQNALDDVTPVGFILLRFGIGAIVLIPFASGAAGGVPARRRRDACATSCAAWSLFGVVGFAGYVFQNLGLNARRRRTPRSSPACSSCSRR